VDTLLVYGGVVLIAYAMVMALVYLITERGEMFDPIVISWAGVGFFVGLAIFSCGAYYPFRKTAETGETALLYAFFAVAIYTLGLYAGKAKKWVAKRWAPRSELSLPEIVLIAVVCGSISVPILVAKVLLPPGWSVIVGAIADGMLGATALVCLMGFFAARGNPVLQLIFIAGVGLVAAMYLNFYWSRRPLGGLLLAGFGFLIQFRMRRVPVIMKMGMFAASIVALVVLLNFLSATRGSRFYGSAVRTHSTFSTEATMDTLVNATWVNFATFEYALQNFPSNQPHLLGSGYVPAFAFVIPRAWWPDKPISTGAFVSQLWYGTKDLDNNLGIVPFGELYVNFGPVGILFGMFLFGRVIRVLNSYLRHNRENQVLWLAWLITMPDIATEWRGDFTSMTVQAFMRVSVFLIVCSGLSAFMSRRSRAPLARALQPVPGFAPGIPAGHAPPPRAARAPAPTRSAISPNNWRYRGLPGGRA
jgi:hypothetical protein